MKRLFQPAISWPRLGEGERWEGRHRASCRTSGGWGAGHAILGGGLLAMGRLMSGGLGVSGCGMREKEPKGKEVEKEEAMDGQWGF